jgi:hypothetical protein
MKQIANTKITRWILSSVLTFISLTLGQAALAKSQDPNSRPYVNPFQTEAGAALICEDCVRIKPEVALGRDITKHISDVFGKKPQEVTTRPVDVRKKNQAFLNAVASINVPVTGLDGEIMDSSGSGTLTTDIEIEDKPCVILTAKHVACGKQVAKKFDGSLYVQTSSAAECTDPKRAIEVKIGKTKDPLGNGFDFTAQAQIIELILTHT